MIVWIFALAVVAILSYLADVGVLTFMRELSAPYLNASNLSILILLCLAGAIARLLWKVKKGEKETLAKRIMELERELGRYKEKKEEK